MKDFVDGLMKFIKEKTAEENRIIVEEAKSIVELVGPRSKYIKEQVDEPKAEEPAKEEPKAEEKKTFDITDELVDQLAKELNIDFSVVDREEFKKGLEVEQEHSEVTGGDPKITAQIALDHLKEMPNYYTMLIAMEKGELEPAELSAEEAEECKKLAEGNLNEPPPALTAMAQEVGKPASKAEEYYKAAKEQRMKATGKTEKELTSDDYRYIMGVVKKRLGLPTKPLADSKVEEGRVPNPKDSEEKIIKALTEQDKMSIIAKGISDKAIADKIAAEKKGQVVSDKDDPKKFMVIVAESSKIKESSEDVEEILEELDDLEEAIMEAIDIAKSASKVASTYGGELDRVVAGQLESYTIPTLESFVNDENQPGSVASLREYLLNEYESEEDEEDEELEEWAKKIILANYLKETKKIEELTEKEKEFIKSVEEARFDEKKCKKIKRKIRKLKEKILDQDPLTQKEPIEVGDKQTQGGPVDSEKKEDKKDEDKKKE